jgi:copper chaperone
MGVSFTLSVEIPPGGVRVPPMHSHTETNVLTLVVEGMSCDHCRVAITDEVSGVSGVDSVEVDLDAKLVHVGGTDVDASAVIDAVDEAGYDAVAA